MRKLMKNICFVFLFAFCAFFMNAIDVKADSGGTGMQDDIDRNQGNGTTNNVPSNSTSDAHGSTKSGICYYTWEYNKSKYVLQITFMNNGTSWKSFKAVTKFVNKTSGETASITNKGDVFSAYYIGAKWLPYKTDTGTGAACFTEAAYKKVSSSCYSLAWDCPVAVCYKHSNNESFELQPKTNSACPSGFKSGNYNSNYSATDDASEIIANKDNYGNDVDWSSTDEEKQNSDVSLKDILEWGSKDANSLYSADDQLNPCTIIDGSLKNLINSVLGFISIAGIILLIIMSMIEFIKALTGSNGDLLKTAFKHTIIRIVCAIILLLLPMIISGIINIINNANGPATDANGNVIMGEDGNPLCGVGE